MEDYIDREVREEDKRRWPNQWAAFIQGRKYVMQGTLDLPFPLIAPASALRLNSSIFTRFSSWPTWMPTPFGRVGIGAQNG